MFVMPEDCNCFYTDQIVLILVFFLQYISTVQGECKVYISLPLGKGIYIKPIVRRRCLQFEPELL